MIFLQKAFDDVEERYLIAGFLLIRQICLEGSHIFIPYKEWFQVRVFGVNFIRNNYSGNNMHSLIFLSFFQKVFGDSNSLAKNKKSFTFLLKFLSDLVPSESAKCLRVG